MLKRSSFNFPLVFELLIWLFYVGIYKYSYYLEEFALRPAHPGYFPFPLVGLYCICSTLYLLPYYRWAVPKLLYKKKYGWLVLLTIFYFVFVTTWNNVAVAWVFRQFTAGLPDHRFFSIMCAGFYIDWNLLLTDAIAFFCIAFARFSFRNEQLRHQIETDHLQLQLTMLKSQLQPHFLFNTLNSLYGMSLSGAKETPRFILLLSQMMQYILYDCDKETVTLEEELDFLQGYFEIEQKKFPGAKIDMEISAQIPNLKIPPLLFLPLIENSFKHGAHKLSNNAGVYARLIADKDKLTFYIENDLIPAETLPASAKRGGIGLTNIKKRLELYYPKNYHLTMQQTGNKYIAELTISP